ncbi:unnamed protein product, partial [Ixodes hexagonus]
NDNTWTRKTSSLNAFFGKQHIYKYVEAQGGSKHREAGLRLFTSGHLHKVEFFDKPCDSTKVRARVLASMATTTFYTVYVALAKDTGDIEGGECSCVAGKGGVCKHVCCVLYGLMTIVTQELKQVPAEVSCTEAERKWYAPRDPKAVSRKFEKLEFTKDTSERISSAPEDCAKRRRYSCLPEDHAKVTRLELISLHATLTQTGLQCMADILEKNDFTPAAFSEKAGCEDADLQHLPPNCIELVKTKKAHNYTKEEIEIVERKTREQSKSELWFRYRKGLITASVANRVYTWVFSYWKKDGEHDPTALLRTLTGKPTKQTSAMKRGLDLEGPAKESFLEENQSHTNITLHDCGLFLSDEFAFIGASPDALIKCECCGVRILEIKAPEVIETFSKKELKNGKLKQTSKFF